MYLFRSRSCLLCRLWPGGEGEEQGQELVSSWLLELRVLLFFLREDDSLCFDEGPKVEC